MITIKAINVKKWLVSVITGDLYKINFEFKYMTSGYYLIEKKDDGKWHICRYLKEEIDPENLCGHVQGMLKIAEFRE